MLPCAKSDAYSRGLPLAVAVARPRYTAPWLGTAMTALLRSTPGFHPEMVPSTVANRKTLERAVPPFLEMLNPPALGSWKTVPVGTPFGEPVAGTLTTNEKGASDEVEVSYRVLVPVPSLATHHSPVGLAVSPQGLTRFLS